MKYLVLAFALLCSVSAPAAPLPPPSVCFRPGPAHCDELIAQAIAGATKSIDVLAYGFTNIIIAKALVEASGRGVTVRAVLDGKTNGPRKGRNYSAATFLMNAGVPVRLDYTVAIAHNKVMVIDGNLVITGSFNFTQAAEKSNAENLLVIRDADLANIYDGAYSFHDRLAYRSFCRPARRLSSHLPQCSPASIRSTAEWG